MPWPAAEAVANEECLDENWDRECDICSNSSDTEDGTDGHSSAEDEEQKSNTNGSIEPHCVDGGVSVLVNALDPPRHRETSITSIGERDSGSSNHAALAHEETADDGKAEDCESDFLGHDLHKVGSPWLAEI